MMANPSAVVMPMDKIAAAAHRELADKLDQIADDLGPQGLGHRVHIRVAATLLRHAAMRGEGG